ncbi:MAG: sugar ABC transporter permease [SAR324 cluster bacterium]|nr:sugar ABC transporter permease [SAR324 cluster bacterium]
MKNSTWPALGFLSPALLVILGTIVFPFGYALFLSFHKWNLKYRKTPFVGFKNYSRILGSDNFWEILGTTAVFCLLSVILIMMIGFLIALLLNEEFWGRSVLRALLLIPWAIPEVVNGILWKWLLDPSFGVANRLFLGLGLIDEYHSWLNTMPSAMICVVMAYVWTHVPLAALILLAGLQSISKEVKEAALVDGAGLFHRLFLITMPLVRPVLVVVLIFETIFALKVFDVIYVLTGGGPGKATTVLGWQIYSRTFINLSFGRGSALAMLLGLITLLVAVLYFKYLNKEED